MKAATLISTPDGFQLEFLRARSSAPTFDLQTIARLLNALDIDVVDVRLGNVKSDAEQLKSFCDALASIRRYRLQ